MVNDPGRLYRMIFSSVYPLYVNKVLRKGRSQDDLDRIIQWLTGYSPEQLQGLIASKKTFEQFFDEAPQIHPHASKITGVICGIRVEDIEDPMVQKVRYLDKLVDELANGKAMSKILRS